MKYLSDSKIIRLLIAGIICVLAICCMVSVYVVADKVENPEVISHRISKFATIKSKEYKDLRLLDTKDELLIGVDLEGKLQFADFDNNIIKTLNSFNGLGIVQGDLVEIKNKKGSTVINYRNVLAGEEYNKKVYDKVQLSENGKYYIGYSFVLDTYEGYDFEVLKPDGTKIFSNKQKISFMGKGDYIAVDKTGDDRFDSIVKLSNLKTIRTFNAGFTPYEKAGDNWIMRVESDSKKLNKSRAYYVLADSNFDPKYNVGVFDKLELSKDGKYLVGKKWVELGNSPTTDEIKESTKVLFVVMDLNGKIIYSSNEQRNNMYYTGEVEFLDVKNDILIYRAVDSKDKYKYVDLKNAETGNRLFSNQIDRGKAFSLLDNEDGICVAVKEVDRTVANIDFSHEMSLKEFEESDNQWMDDFEWGFTDENNELICDYMFSGAYPTVDGYAVVKTANYWKLIKFK